ncbi:MAG: YihA family ribosome biogenesis GTP-binding protein, partial [Flavobacteriales bacterium]|nr:YihA family ribosome biogenesis GTP-binding protein [Flavobacteriales bacterium]
MIVKTAEFIISNTEVSKCPNDGLPEFAFIGRSNVGKSSLINMLTGKKNLAKTSGTPGKTQLINHFLIN